VIVGLPPGEWLRDTVRCVFLARAIDRIGVAKFPGTWTSREQGGIDGDDEELDRRRNEAYDTIVDAIAAGKLKMCGRLAAGGGDFIDLAADEESPEGWLEAFQTCQILKGRDPPEGQPGELRRRVPEWHHLFVIRDSLDGFVRALEPPTTAKEKQAQRLVADHLKANPNLKRDDAQKACEHLGISGAGFKRVWPDARVMAGLSPTAPKGRKARA
jgi:hypothetical protein